MANRNYHAWQAHDSLWTVAARYLDMTGYSNTITLAEAIRAANPTIHDWTAVPVDTLVYLPIISFS